MIGSTFSKLVQRAESKTAISFGPTRHNFSLWGVEILRNNRKCQNLGKMNLELTENGRRQHKMDLKIGFRVEKQFRGDIVPFFVIIFYSDFSIFLFGGLFPLMLHQRKKAAKKENRKIRVKNDEKQRHYIISELFFSPESDFEVYFALSPTVFRQFQIHFSQIWAFSIVF